MSLLARSSKCIGLNIPTKALLTRSSVRYSSTHSKNEHEHHEGEEHGHEDHGHHELPLSEPENIVNKYTVGTAAIALSVLTYSYYDTSYKESHEGKSLLSIITKPKLLEKVEANYNEYRSNVARDIEFYDMVQFRKEKTPGNVITTIRDVPGRVQPFGGDADFNTIRDFSDLAPRKVPQNPFK